MNNNVSNVAKCGMCASCGICKGVCKTDCISFELNEGQYIPVIDQEKCVNCGLCMNVCPGKGFDYEDSDIQNFWEGQYKQVLIAKSKNKDIYEHAVSGGVATTLIKSLLEKNEYDVAFVVKDNRFDGQVMSEQIDLASINEITNTQKSRYLQVSHEKAVEYILNNKDKKVIFVGVSCFVQGLMNVIKQYKLNRDNYFIIGLFCDKTLTNNVVRYFEDRFPKKEIDKFYFRDKKAFGYPGGIYVVFKDGSSKMIPNTERMNVKNIFLPERCLYCLDKINKYADVSLGDNYTGEYIVDSDKKTGSNSVILRTDKAEEMWQLAAANFEYTTSDMALVKKAQSVDKRKRNLYFAKLKEKQMGTVIYSSNVPSLEERDVSSEYKMSQDQLLLGKKYPETKKQIANGLRSRKIKQTISRLFRRR